MNGPTGNGIIALVAGIYLVMVVKNGNTTNLLDQLKTETGYAEFLVAAMILSAGIQYDETGLGKPLVVLGLSGMGLSLVGRLNIGNAAHDFGTGKVGLFEAIKEIFQPVQHGLFGHI